MCALKCVRHIVDFSRLHRLIYTYELINVSVNNVTQYGMIAVGSRFTQAVNRCLPSCLHVRRINNLHVSLNPRVLIGRGHRALSQALSEVAYALPACPEAPKRARLGAFVRGLSQPYKANRPPAPLPHVHDLSQNRKATRKSRALL